MKCGVYKITNTANGKFYIGCSKHVEKRWNDHIHDYKEKHQENKPLYIDMKEYGVDKFKIEILEECEEILLPEREMYYIKTLLAVENGYNAQALEKHNNSKMTREDVIDIRTRYGNKERKKEVYEIYKHKINKTGFHKIWNFATWKSIMPEVRTEDNIIFHKNNTSQKCDTNGTAKLKNHEVFEIRTRKKNGEDIKEVYKQYEDRMTYRSFRNVWNGYNWKEIIV